MTQEDFEKERAEQFLKLRSFMNLNTNENSVPAMYALMEIIQDRLDRLDLTDYQKGAIITDALNKMANNKVELAAFRDIRNYITMGQEATKH